MYKKAGLEEEIPVRPVLNNKKLVKYFNRETALGIICLSELLEGVSVPSDTPLYYDTGLVEYEDFGLNKIVENCAEDGTYSQETFVGRGMSVISPMTQFKILLNMPLCFLSIENNITGDNAVTYSSAVGLLTHARLAETDGVIIIGAGKVNADGAVESGFALLSRSELGDFNGEYKGKEGIEVFRQLNSKGEN
ncbi:MAG: hypothetical protein WAV84_06400 [Bacteroidota bacterium]